GARGGGLRRGAPPAGADHPARDPGGPAGASVRLDRAGRPAAAGVRRPPCPSRAPFLGEAAPRPRRAPPRSRVPVEQLRGRGARPRAARAHPGERPRAGGRLRGGLAAPGGGRGRRCSAAALPRAGAGGLLGGRARRQASEPRGPRRARRGLVRLGRAWPGPADPGAARRQTRVAGAARRRGGAHGPVRMMPRRSGAGGDRLAPDLSPGWPRAGTVGIALAAMAMAAGLAGLGASLRATSRAIAELTAGIERERLGREALAREMLADRTRLAAYQADVRNLIAAGRAEVTAVERTVQALEAERLAGERIIRAYGPGVALLQGTLVYEDREGRPLRYSTDAAHRRRGEPPAGPRISLDGRGDVVESTFLGTGFLASRDGAVLTNRHIAYPWERDDELGDLLEQEGLTPRVVQLRALFPGVPEPVALSVVRASRDADVVVLRGRVPT